MPSHSSPGSASVLVSSSLDVFLTYTSFHEMPNYDHSRKLNLACFCVVMAKNSTGVSTYPTRGHHTAWMPDESNAKQILTASPSENWRSQLGCPPYYVDEDYPAGPGIIEPLPQWSRWRSSESSTLENDVYVWHYALIVVHARNEWMNECHCAKK